VLLVIEGHNSREIFSWPVRVYWEDTDGGGVVYHSRYLNFFERARTELIRAAGIDQVEMKEKHNLIWVVLEMNVKFRNAAKMDDELLVSAGFDRMKGVRLGMRQEIHRKSSGELVASADVIAVLLQADTLKPARMPAWIKEKLEKQGL
jgi:acyl-CoA thioester hydrolase